MVIALAGRRIDDTHDHMQRFPPENIPMVEQKLKKYFADNNVTVLICSAACGADLLALSAARSLGIKKIIVLPFDPETFKSVSVTDRPGNWGKMFNRLVTETEGDDEVINLNITKDNPNAFADVNITILLKAHSLPGAQVVIVWDGHTKSKDDITFQFLQTAEKFNLPIHQISTL